MALKHRRRDRGAHRATKRWAHRRMLSAVRRSPEWNDAMIRRCHAPALDLADAALYDANRAVPAAYSPDDLSAGGSYPVRRCCA